MLSVIIVNTSSDKNNRIDDMVKKKTLNFILIFMCSYWIHSALLFLIYKITYFTAMAFKFNWSYAYFNAFLWPKVEYASISIDAQVWKHYFNEYDRFKLAILKYLIFKVLSYLSSNLQMPSRQISTFESVFWTIQNVLLFL